MQIGQAAKRVGLETSAIRYYENSQIVPQPRRTAAGYRDYEASDIDLLQFVRRLRSLDLPLNDVREIVSLRSQGKAPCAKVRSAIAREAAVIETRIAELQLLQTEINQLQQAAATITDDWPSACICEVLTSSPDREDS